MNHTCRCDCRDVLFRLYVFCPEEEERICLDYYGLLTLYRYTAVTFSKD